MVAVLAPAAAAAPTASSRSGRAESRIRDSARPIAVEAPGRDRFVDLLRAGSLLVVVAWHWVFTVVVWKADGPHASNPLGSTKGLWALTWLLQVMPLFFWVGGFVHARTWKPGSGTTGGYAAFLRKRLGRLVAPALVTVGAVVAGGLLANSLLGSPPWMARSVVLLLTPLWFLGVYVCLVLATPIAAAAHRRFGELAVVGLAGTAALADVLRFRFDVPYASVLSWIAVWGFAHQLGFFYERLVAAPRRLAQCLVVGGFFALLALTNMGHYPKSMVGVPGEAFSNMAPPTICIVALCLLQVGVVVLVRPAALRLLDRNGRASRAVDWMSANGMSLYLWHGVGFAATYVAVRAIGVTVPGTTTGAWWLQRPLWAIVPAVATYPLLRASLRPWRRARP